MIVTPVLVFGPSNTTRPPSLGIRMFAPLQSITAPYCDNQSIPRITSYRPISSFSKSTGMTTPASSTATPTNTPMADISSGPAVSTRVVRPSYFPWKLHLLVRSWLTKLWVAPVLKSVYATTPPTFTIPTRRLYLSV
ncbi:hypothetical protein Bca52824_075541 [Brassica carinata]|uniref:Uncharacterized protein n=1 Tax=Brassica carinata TaxID=52824 RepID=A0A8X7TVT8_BRACI|nr:hypothetical protein Bca52824_075541 [Brassica carinata]